jgi:hypothetical protein
MFFHEKWKRHKARYQIDLASILHRSEIGLCIELSTQDPTTERERNNEIG